MRLHRGGNRQLNSAFHRIVVTQMRVHPPARDYIARRTAEGKTKREAIRCLKRHLVRTIYNAMTPTPDQTPAPTLALTQEQRVISEESTTPDLVELVVAFFEAANRRDLEARMSFFAPEAVWDLSPMGIGTFEGRAAIRRFLEDWRSSYEELRWALEEVVDLGNGVVLAVTRQDALMAGGGAPLHEMWVYVFVWVEGMVARVIPYGDIDRARAAAERLAADRG